MIDNFKNLSRGLKIKFVNFGKFFLIIIPRTNGAKTKTSSCVNEAAWSILNSLDLVVIIVS